jgi:hypothetical protein
MRNQPRGRIERVKVFKSCGLTILASTARGFSLWQIAGLSGTRPPLAAVHARNPGLDPSNRLLLI